MKTKKELNALKEGVESERMRILTDDEIKLVSGGGDSEPEPGTRCDCGGILEEYEPEPDPDTGKYPANMDTMSICPRCHTIYHCSYGRYRT